MRSVGWLAWLGMTLIFASASLHANDAVPFRQLPSGVDVSKLANGFGTHFQQRRVQAIDSRGRIIRDIPARVIDEDDANDYSSGKWVLTPKDQKAPDPFTVVVPPTLRERIALYWLFGHWQIAPRGWRVVYAYIMGDSTTAFGLVAPGGNSQGWFIFQVINACAGCMYLEADGFIPGAHQGLNDVMFVQDASTPEPRFAPTLTAIAHPDRCTAVFAYQSAKSLPVEAAMLSDWDRKQLDFVGSIYVGMPAKEKPLARFIVQSYLASRSTCRNPNVSRR